METNISKPQVTVKALIHLSLLLLSVTSLQTGVLGESCAGAAQSKQR